MCLNVSFRQLVFSTLLLIVFAFSDPCSAQVVGPFDLMHPWNSGIWDVTRPTWRPFERGSTAEIQWRMDMLWTESQYQSAVNRANNYCAGCSEAYAGKKIVLGHGLPTDDRDSVLVSLASEELAEVNNSTVIEAINNSIVIEPINTSTMIYAIEPGREQQVAIGAANYVKEAYVSGMREVINYSPNVQLHAEGLWNRAYYRELNNQFTSQGLDPFKQNVAAGPLQAFAIATGKPFYDKDIDLAYINSNELNIATPGMYSNQIIKTLIGDNFLNLGLLDTPIVTGTREALSDAYDDSEYDFNQYDGLYAESMIMVVTDKNFKPIRGDGSTLIHEMSHSAVDFVAQLNFVKVLASPDLSIAQKMNAVIAIPMARAIQSNSTNIADEAGIDPNLNRDIFTDDELLAYSQTDDRETIATSVFEKYQVTTAESYDYADSLLNSASMTYYKETTSRLGNSLDPKAMQTLIHLRGW